MGEPLVQQGGAGCVVSRDFEKVAGELVGLVEATLQDHDVDEVADGERLGMACSPASRQLERRLAVRLGVGKVTGHAQIRQRDLGGHLDAGDPVAPGDADGRLEQRPRLFEAAVARVQASLANKCRRQRLGELVVLGQHERPLERLGRLLDVTGEGKRTPEDGLQVGEDDGRRGRLVEGRQRLAEADHRLLAPAECAERHAEPGGHPGGVDLAPRLGMGRDRRLEVADGTLVPARELGHVPRPFDETGLLGLVGAELGGPAGRRTRPPRERRRPGPARRRARRRGKPGHGARRRRGHRRRPCRRRRGGRRSPRRPRHPRRGRRSADGRRSAGAAPCARPGSTCRRRPI